VYVAQYWYEEFFEQFSRLLRFFMYYSLKGNQEKVAIALEFLRLCAFRDVFPLVHG
jgi:hypothetical protein